MARTKKQATVNVKFEFNPETKVYTLTTLNRETNEPIAQVSGTHFQKTIAGNFRKQLSAVQLNKLWALSKEAEKKAKAVVGVLGGLKK